MPMSEERARALLNEILGGLALQVESMRRCAEKAAHHYEGDDYQLGKAAAFRCDADLLEGDLARWRIRAGAL